MAVDPGNVTIAPDGSATGTGLALSLYTELADEYGVDDLPPAGQPGSPTPGAQESLAQMARGVSRGIAADVDDDGGGGGGIYGVSRAQARLVASYRG